MRLKGALALFTYKYILILNIKLIVSNACFISCSFISEQNELVIGGNSNNAAGLRQNIKFQAQNSWTINMKADNSLNNESHKIKIKYEYRTDNVIFPL